MKLGKFINTINKETDIVIKCDKDLALGYDTLCKCKISQLEGSSLNDGKVNSVTLEDNKLVVELTLDYRTLVKYLMEQNIKLKDKSEDERGI